MAGSDQATRQAARDELLGQIADSQRLPAGGDRVKALLHMPIRPCHALGQAHGDALFEAAQAALDQGSTALARIGFVAAAARAVPGSPEEIRRTTHYLHAAQTPVASAGLGLVNVLSEVREVCWGSRWLEANVGQQFVKAFDRLVRAGEGRHAVMATVRAVADAPARDTNPGLVDLLRTTVRRQLVRTPWLPFSPQDKFRLQRAGIVPLALAGERPGSIYALLARPKGDGPDFPAYPGS